MDDVVVERADELALLIAQGDDLVAACATGSLQDQIQLQCAVSCCAYFLNGTTSDDVVGRNCSDLLARRNR